MTVRPARPQALTVRTAASLVLASLFLVGLVAGCSRTNLPLAEAEERLDEPPRPAAAIVEISVGTEHACAARADGSVLCWGRNDQGQLGDGTREDRLLPTFVSGLTDVVRVAPGKLHSCALLRSGHMRCWGNRSLGQLGEGGELVGSTVGVATSPVSVVDVQSAVGLAVGDASSCFVAADGNAFCFGSNDFGELGDGRRERSSFPKYVQDLAGATSIAVGATHACARVSDGTARCWGSNENLQLGARPTHSCGGFECARRAQQVIGLANAVSIAASQHQSCAVLTDRTITCWGNTLEGLEIRPTPVRGISDVEEIALGRTHLCARLGDGSVVCVGDGRYGQLGVEVDETEVPLRVPGLSDVVRIAAGGDTTCALTGDGAAWCFGRNDKGQVGDGSVIDRAGPVRILRVP